MSQTIQIEKWPMLYSEQCFIKTEICGFKQTDRKIEMVKSIPYFNKNIYVYSWGLFQPVTYVHKKLVYPLLASFSGTRV